MHVGVPDGLGEGTLVLDGRGSARNVHGVQGRAEHGHVGPDASGQTRGDLRQLMEGQAAALEVVAAKQAGAAAVGNHHDVVSLGGGLHAQGQGHV